MNVYVPIRNLAFLITCATLGCYQAPVREQVVTPVQFNRYQAPGFNWSSIRRVLIVPLCNESMDPRATNEIREILSAELQSRSTFEVVVAPLDAPPEWSSRVRFSGQFDEMELVELAQAYHADAVLCGSITRYHAFAPPRVGLSLRLISTAEGIVIASVDGQWDSRDQVVAEEACAFYGRSEIHRPSNSGPDAVLMSPRLFQKYVCAHVSYVLAGPGVIPVAAVPAVPVSVDHHPLHHAPM